MDAFLLALAILLLVMQTQAMRPSLVRNDARLELLGEAWDRADREALMTIMSDRTHNTRLHRRLYAKDAVWTELKEDVVFKVTFPEETVVVKVFDEFPFHELGGNLIATRLIPTAGPLFVRTLDMGRSIEGSSTWILVLEFLEVETEAINLDDPHAMYCLFFQTAWAVAQMERAARLQHFDLRFDNIMIRLLPSPRDLFKDGTLHDFVIKVGDFGQCEFDFGDERPPNPELPREEALERKWGTFPTTYSGYDFQYFVMTLRPILDSLHGLSFYYIHGMLLDYLQPCTWTAAQDRPIQITRRTPKNILAYLRTHVRPTL